MIINVYLARMFTKRKKSDSDKEIIQQKPQENKKCFHHFGYLAKRKKSPIPEECFSCEKAIECIKS
jgi:hypothetical protein